MFIILEETALQEISEPYYLKIWIFKDFMRSQVILIIVIRYIITITCFRK